MLEETLRKFLRQGGHMFQKLNSLSFPWDFQGIFKFFPEQLKRGNSMECIFVGYNVKYFHFPWVFQVFSAKLKISLRFWQF